MGKKVYIAEKPSVARQFADALGGSFRGGDGFMERDDAIVTWCVGHLVSMSYPEAYDPALKRWSMDTLPFLPEHYKYEVIDSVKKQFGIVKKILTRSDVDTIYVCTDSGREGEYIYRLVAQQAGVKDKRQLRVWIDSQTKEEILRGIREAKDEREYDNLGAAAYLRAREDYLMGINFSRALTLRYGRTISETLGTERTVIAVGRVMTCVLGMVVSREREIRDFVKTPFYKVSGSFLPAEGGESEETLTAEWRVCPGSRYEDSPVLYSQNGFKKREDAEQLIASLQGRPASVESVTHKKERKNPPLLYNLAELQNDCSRYFRISPDQTLQAAQELYEKKLTTYPRTDARVLSSAVAKEIGRNLQGLSKLPQYRPYLQQILQSGSFRKIGSTRYTNDKAITDHYAIIPTGEGLQALASLSPTTAGVYELIVRRFLAIFYPPAVFDRISVQVRIDTECFFAGESRCVEEGYREVMQYSFRKGGAGDAQEDRGGSRRDAQPEDAESGEAEEPQRALPAFILNAKKGMPLRCTDLQIREGETKPPKRYNSGSLILAMENAGKLIEEEELREQIRGSGIGTSATRAEILKKLVSNQYLSLHAKSQIVTPTVLGEMIYDTVAVSMRALLDPKLTASWEMGLSRVSEGTVSEDEYMEKLTGFVRRRTEDVKENDRRPLLRGMYARSASLYPAFRPQRKTHRAAGTGTSGKGGKSTRSAGRKSGASGKKSGTGKGVTK
ncbi:MAG: type IA DNA topoisomerase [Lachnospiraceae bacterium]|nr:type IA DNA topoisomerase [Lachnospiraceae bacterium]